jgi:hypothetical protein
VSAIAVAALIVGSVAGYVFFATMSFAIAVTGLGWDEDEPASAFATIAWPLALPGMLGVIAGRRIVSGLGRRGGAALPEARVVERDQ